MIDIVEKENQNVIVKETTEKYEINLENVNDQVVKVSGDNKVEQILIENAFPLQRITVGIPQEGGDSFAIALDSKVPKDLSILSPMAEGQFNNINARNKSKIYVDIDGSPRYATIEQIKALNTKTIYVDRLSDGRISDLSNEDIILLKKEV